MLAPNEQKTLSHNSNGDIEIPRATLSVEDAVEFALSILDLTSRLTNEGLKPNEHKGRKSDPLGPPKKEGGVRKDLAAPHTNIQVGGGENSGGDFFTELLNVPLKGSSTDPMAQYFGSYRPITVVPHSDTLNFKPAAITGFEPFKEGGATAS
jgi:hypothetical protein